MGNGNNLAIVMSSSITSIFLILCYPVTVPQLCSIMPSCWQCWFARIHFWVDGSAVGSNNRFVSLLKACGAGTDLFIWLLFAGNTIIFVRWTALRSLYSFVERHARCARFVSLNRYGSLPLFHCHLPANTPDPRVIDLRLMAAADNGNSKSCR